jgi:hypothetical protein
MMAEWEITDYASRRRDTLATELAAALSSETARLVVLEIRSARPPILDDLEKLADVLEKAKRENF